MKNNNFEFTNYDKQLLELGLSKKLSVENNIISINVLKQYYEEMQIDSPFEKLNQLNDENNFLRKELHRLKNSKPKPKTYKYMVRNSLGNANFNVNKLASYLNNSSISNQAVDEFLNTAIEQLIDLINILGVNNEQ